MFDIFKPHKAFYRPTDISPAFLQKYGIKLVLLDIDNTLSPYYRTEPIKGLDEWLDSLRKTGITPAIVSNNKTNRAIDFAGSYGMECIINAHKPKPDGILKMMERFSAEPANTCIIGDQIYADVEAGNRAGIYTFLVQPIVFNNPLFALRYVAELPFRKLTKLKD